MEAKPYYYQYKTVKIMFFFSKKDEIIGAYYFRKDNKKYGDNIVIKLKTSKNIETIKRKINKEIDAYLKLFNK